ncbi:MAG: ATP-binding protein [Gemmatirosa sp.]
MTWGSDDATTARVRGEAPVARAEGRDPLVAALAQLTEGVIVVDASGRITFVNEAAARLHGTVSLGVDPAQYADAYGLYTEDGQPYASEQLPLSRAVLHGETVREARWRIRRPDGTEVHVVGSARPVLGPDRARVGAVLTVRDDTAPWMALTASARRAEQLAALSAALAVASTVDEVAAAVVAHAAAVLQAVGVVIARLDAGGTHLEIMRVGAMPDDVREEWRRIPLAAPVPLAEVARTGQPLFLESTDDWGARFPAMLPLLAATGHHANAVAPLVVDGRVLGVVGAAYDAPRRFDDAARALTRAVAQQAAQALERARLFEAERTARAESEVQSARFRAVQDAAVDGFALARAVRGADGAVIDFDYVYANPAAAALTGGAVPTLVGRRMLDVFPYLVEAGAFAAYAAVADGGPPFLTEMAYHADGLDAVFRISAVRIAPDEVAIGFSDVSERTRLRTAEQQALAQARAAREHLERVISQAPVSMYIARGREHVYEVVNGAWCAIVQRRPEDVVGRPVREVFPEVGAQGIYDLVERVYDTGEAHADAAQRIVLDGDGRSAEHFFNIVYQPLRDATGAVYAMAVVSTEVTELVQARRDAETALGVAESANRAKSEFLAVMSHELRTPLNAIGGYAELIELGIYGPVTAEQRDALARIQTSQRHLLGLINEVLNYTRVEAGVVRYDVGEVPMAATLETCETLTAPQVSARRLTLVVAACQPATLAVRADREKVQQIVLNLLSNAIKFTEPGGRIRVWCTPTATRVLLHVADTGRGIPADQLERVFEPFVQVDASRTRTQEGVGLGLAISRDLARGMGGDLTVASVPGEGSTFTLELPRGGG